MTVCLQAAALQVFLLTCLLRTNVRAHKFLHQTIASRQLRADDMMLREALAVGEPSLPTTRTQKEHTHSCTLLACWSVVHTRTHRFPCVASKDSAFGRLSKSHQAHAKTANSEQVARDQAARLVDESCMLVKTAKNKLENWCAV